METVLLGVAVCVCMCACMCACIVRACVHACVRVCQCLVSGVITRWDLGLKERFHVVFYEVVFWSL